MCHRSKLCMSLSGKSAMNTYESYKENGANNLSTNESADNGGGGWFFELKTQTKIKGLLN